MKKALFEKIIVEAHDLGFKNLDLRNMGEPLLDSNLSSYVQFAEKYGFDNIYIHTNGSLLTRDRFENLCESGMNRLILSLSPKREFSLTRGSGKFEMIIENLKDISASDYKNRLVIDFINAGESTDEETLFFKREIDSLGFAIREKIELHNWAEGAGHIADNSTPCHRLWDSVTILSNGQCALCCLDYDGKINLGNINETSLSRIINGNQYINIRAGNSRGELLDICKKCNMNIVKK